MLPRAIKSRAKTLRFVVAAGFADPAFKPTSKAFVPESSRGSLLKAQYGKLNRTHPWIFGRKLVRC
jgi:hypothetical protein